VNSLEGLVQETLHKAQLLYKGLIFSSKILFCNCTAFTAICIMVALAVFSFIAVSSADLHISPAVYWSGNMLRFCFFIDNHSFMDGFVQQFAHISSRPYIIYL
jgi:hypothetical protein